jgi:hypothetical protein
VFDKDAIGSDDFMGGFKIPLKSLGTKPVIAWHHLRGDCDRGSPSPSADSSGSETPNSDIDASYVAAGKGKKDKGGKSKTTREGLGKLQLRLFAHLGSGVGLIANDDTEFSMERMFSEKFLETHAGNSKHTNGTRTTVSKMGGEGGHSSPGRQSNGIISGSVSDVQDVNERGGELYSTLEDQMGSATKGKQRWAKISKSELVLKKLKQLKQLKQLGKGNDTNQAAGALPSLREGRTNEVSGARERTTPATDMHELSIVSTKMTRMMELMSAQTEALNARIAAVEEKQHGMHPLLTPTTSSPRPSVAPCTHGTKADDRRCVQGPVCAGPPIPLAT